MEIVQGCSMEGLLKASFDKGILYIPEGPDTSWLGFWTLCVRNGVEAPEQKSYHRFEACSCYSVADSTPPGSTVPKYMYIYMHVTRVCRNMRVYYLHMSTSCVFMLVNACISVYMCIHASVHKLVYAILLLVLLLVFVLI